MDTITQGLAGAVIGQAISDKKLVRKITFLAFLTAMLPDLDVFIRSFHNPLIFISYHRQFTHSLIFIPVGGLIAMLLGLLIWPALRPYKWRVLLITTLSYATHGVIDVMTTYGTELFWPFSQLRLSWDIISIVDPVVTVVLLLGTVIAYSYRRPNAARWAICAFLLYIGFACWQHHRGMQAQQQLIAKRHQQTVQRRVVPELGHLFRWRSVYIYNNNVYFDGVSTPLWGKSTVKKGVYLPLMTDAQLPNDIRHNIFAEHAYKTFKWFCQDYVVLVRKHPLVVADARLIRGMHPLKLLWGLLWVRDGKNNYQVKWIRQPEAYAGHIRKEP